MADLLKLVAVMALTVALLVRRWNLGLVLLLDSLLTALLFGYPLVGWIESLARGVVAPATLNLVLAVFLVLLLAELMRHTRATQGMVDALQVLVPDGRISVALLPLVLGLMPMLGGAMFSAPMVDEVGTPLGMGAGRKTFVNYWFRHATEYVFPLYSSLLVVSALLGVSVYEFIAAAWPLTVVALVSGLLWGIVGVSKSSGSGPLGGRSVRRSAWSRLLSSTWPLLLVILTVAVLRLPMSYSLVGVIVIYIAARRVPARVWWRIVKASFPITTFAAIFGVMVFKQVIEDSGAVSQIPQALMLLGLPSMLVAFAVPLLVGLLTGTAAAALALSVPLAAPLLAGSALSDMGAGVWLFVGGFSGILLSPLHLCLALTKDYYGATWGKLYRRIVPSVALVVAFAVVWVRLL